MKDIKLEPVSPEMLRTLPTPDLAITLLRSLVDEEHPSAHNLLSAAKQRFVKAGEKDANSLVERLSDAWAWLEAHALVGPSTTQDTSTFSRITASGREIAINEAALPRLWAEERLAGGLHPALERHVRTVFNLGDYETACFAAMKQVEVAVRESSGLDDEVIGVDLMRQAFNPKGGPLTEGEVVAGERVALMELFAGAIGAFKNPSSHRTVHFDDPTEAAEVVQLADLLLRIIQRRASRDVAPGRGG